ncbi:MAG: ABC transporter permease [Bacteroidales bacterium]|nr:ABC transporter permease [Bacteroidales bacterium]
MRLDIDNFREIADSLTRNKSRSLLTGFGVFWGVFMLLIMLGGGQGFKSMVSSIFTGFASNTSILMPDRTTKPYGGFREGRSWNLNYTDIERLRQGVPELDAITPIVFGPSAMAYYEKNSSEAYVQGINPDYAKMEEPRMKYGRYLNDADLLQKRRVCVIGKQIYADLFPDGGDPCGQFIKAGPSYFQIVGVDVSSAYFSVGIEAAYRVSIPITVCQQLYNRGSNVDMICATGYRGIVMSEIEPKMRQIIARAHKLDPTDKQAIGVFNTEQIFNIIDNLFNGVAFLVWLVGLGTIFGGVIGVSNIMMVTVKERTTEIGIRRAIGATPRNILTQIISESIALTLVAGSFGIVLAVYMLRFLEIAVDHSGEYPAADFQIGFWLAIGAALLLTVLGIVAGLAPATRAMAIKPVDAMRDE